MRERAGRLRQQSLRRRVQLHQFQGAFRLQVSARKERSRLRPTYNFPLGQLFGVVFIFIYCSTDDGLKHEILVPEFNSVQSILSSSPAAAASSSYVAIGRPFQVGQNLDLEVWFLSRSTDGMLAYSALDENGRGDFIWLALIGGRVQFRWDLGSGAGIVT